MEFELSGDVRTQTSGKPVVGVVVEAWDIPATESDSNRDKSSTTQPHAGSDNRPADQSGTDSSDSHAQRRQKEEWLFHQPSLGSDITKADGSFSIKVNRDDASTTELFVALAVLAPDGPRQNGGPSLLHLASRVRRVGAGSHRYAIVLPHDTASSIPSSSDSSIAPGAGMSAKASAAETAKSRAELTQGMSELRKTQATQLRSDRKEAKGRVQEALYNRATQSVLDSAGKLPVTFVRRDEKVRARTTALLRNTLNNNANGVVTNGLVDIGPEDAALLLNPADGSLLLKADGTPKATNEDIERLLFGRNHKDGPPTRLRRDVIAVAGRDRDLPYGSDDPTDDSETETPAEAGVEAPADKADEIKKYVWKLLHVTEQIGTPGGVPASRLTPTELGDQLQDLLLREGPAEAVAQFDFERLFLASDIANRHKPDHNLVNSLTDTALAIKTHGGDLDGYRAQGIDMLSAIENELQVLIAAQEDLSVKKAQEPLLKMKSFAGPKFVARGFFDGIREEIQEGLEQLAETLERAKKYRYASLPDFLEKLQELRREDYGFTAFGTDKGGRAATYGLVLTYTQNWRPKGHQAGDLVKTIPLAPRSSVKYQFRHKTGRTYTDKRAEASESAYSRESQDVNRDIYKIVRNSKLATNFELKVETGGGVPGVASTTTSSVWTTSAERSSESTKDTFREQIRKEAEQHKSNTSIEVSVTTSEETEISESREITNPNDELVVTYLFYELQRRFEVSERLTKVTPVVLVAQDLPDPSEIDESWVARHAWILRRVILDPSFLPALDDASSGRLGARQAKAMQLDKNLDMQADLVETVQHQVEALQSPEPLPDEALFLRSFLIDEFDIKFPNWRSDPEKVKLVYGSDTAARVAQWRQAKKEAEETLKKEVGRLDDALTQFNKAFELYALSAVQVERLLLHIRDHILYYTQAILDHEDNDQAYLRLRNHVIPDITGTITWSLSKSDRPPRAPQFRPPLAVKATATLDVGNEKPLGEVADLSRGLGYVGNALVFPMQSWNPLITFLLVPFANAITGVTDPDERGNLTLPEVADLIRLLKKRLPAEEFKNLQPALEEAWKARVQDPRVDTYDIVVPTGSLFIEALPGTHPVLEDYKLVHRGLDMQQAANTVVGTRIEHLRQAIRIVSGDYEDPDVEKVIIRDDSPVVIDPS